MSRELYYSSIFCVFILIGGGVIIPHIDLSVTTKCSLKCKNCTQWNPYIHNPQTFSSQSIINNLEKLFANIDYLFRLAILGGEPFINNELADVIDYLVKQKKLGMLLVITNGTIIPSEKIINSMRNDKVQVWLDKYGNNSKKADELHEILLANDINVWFDRIHSWLDFGLISKKYSDPKDIEEIFYSCYLRHCFGFYDGKLYRCSRSYVLENNGLEQPGEYECIDVNAIHDKRQMQLALKKFYALDYIKACGWCNKKEDRRVIPTGEQL